MAFGRAAVLVAMAGVIVRRVVVTLAGARFAILYAAGAAVSGGCMFVLFDRR
ncbi:hypothetical protein D9M68_611670 [compost metagenome]